MPLVSLCVSCKSDTLLENYGGDIDTLVDALITGSKLQVRPDSFTRSLHLATVCVAYGL